MAIPTGTTARQLAAVARWALAGAVSLGMLSWWWPGFRSWGGLGAALLVVLCLWLLWRTVSGDRTVPGHPVHLVLLGPAAVLTYHFAASGLGTDVRDSRELGGGLDLSMLYQLFLLAACVMLTQSLLPLASDHPAVLALCGAAMMGGAAAAMAWGGAQPVRQALSLLGFGGIGVWLAPLWGGSAAADGAGALRRRDARMVCAGVAVIAAVGLTVAAPRGALPAWAIIGGVLVVAGLVFPERRAAFLAAGAGLGAVALAIAAATGQVGKALSLGPTSLLGRGEKAFQTLSAADSGLAVLGGTVGWAGLLWLACGLGLCAALMMRQAARTDTHPGRVIVWTAATALASCALLAPAGLFMPAATLAAGFTWGLLPAMLGRQDRPRPGAILLLAVGGLDLLLALARNVGLTRWSAGVMGGGDKFLHAASGFLVAMILAWLLGARRLWGGLAGIAIATLSGAAAEWLQQVASRRGMEWQDMVFHAIGCGAALAPYLLAMGARWCESPDALPDVEAPDRYDRPR